MLLRLGSLSRLNSEQATGVKADIASIRDAICHRIVSKASDEVLCRGTLLDFDVITVARVAPEDRMKELWSILPSAFGGIPKYIIFYPALRLIKEVYRWAPSSSLIPSNEHNPFLGPRLRGHGWKVAPTLDGLLVTFPGFRSQPSIPTLRTLEAQFIAIGP